MKTFFCLILFSTLLFSCSKKDEKNNAELSYIKAKKLLDNKDYNLAAETFEKIDDEFPFSRWGEKGKVMATYARYKEEEKDKTLQLVEDFMRLNPNSEYVPYMIYMKGLTYYNQIPSIERSQDDTQKASFTFRELIARFPDDFHTSDAEKKLKFIDEHLAGAKMSVGRYQLFNHNYLGAIGNFNDVIRLYRHTNQVPEAYFRLTEIYYKIGLKDEGLRAADKLKLKFPQNHWTKSAEKIVKKF